MSDVIQLVNALRTNRRGVTAVEYGIMASLIAVAIIAAVTAMSTRLQATFAAVGVALR